MDSQVTVDAAPINNSDADINFDSTPIRENEPISVPVNKTDELYKMDHEKRGYALIFSHENFNSNLELDPRSESKQSASQLRDALIKLEFEAEICPDFTYEQIKTKVNELCSRQEDLVNSDCIMIIVMTHGLYNDHLYSKDTHYPPDDLRLLFTTKQCPSLAGKPKLFILQACRGTQQDIGTKMKQSTATAQTDGPTSKSKNAIYRLPAHADFLTAYSTAPKHTAYRKPFIEALCEELSSKEVKERQIDFLSMLTNVQRKVAIGKNEDQKQIPSVTSTLTRKIFF